MKQYIGVDIGGTKIAIVKGDELGNVTNKIRFDNNGCVSDCLARIVEAVKEMGPADAIGISCGGPLDAQKGLILSPPNLPGWDEIAIVQMLKDATGIPTFLQNDADACALAEWKFGAGRGTRNMIFLTFGTGLGAGLMLNGALYSGTSGMAGEVGHMALEKDGPVGYGKAGSFEGFCSGGGLRQLGVAKARQMLDAGLTPSFCPDETALASVTAQKVAQYANEGHEDALSVYRLCGEMLGRGLSVLVDILNPERIVIGSIYARAGNLLDEAMYQTLSEQALPQSLKACTIVPAALGESIGDVAALSVAVNGLQRSN
jgi:glucokinase